MEQSYVQMSPTEGSVIPKPQQWGGLGPLRLSNHENKKDTAEKALYIKVNWQSRTIEGLGLLEI